MGNKPSILAYFKKGMSIGACENFVETWNWMSKWCANLKAGTGLQWKNQDSDTPELKVILEEGEGIKITTTSGGAYKISLKTDDGDDDGGDGDSDSGGGSGSDRGNTTNNGTNGGGNGSSGNSYSQKSSSGSNGTDCNDWSTVPDNSSSDEGMSNPADSCSELNGW